MTTVSAANSVRAQSRSPPIVPHWTPVLLSEQADFDAWLSAPPDEAYQLVRTYDAERMRIVQSGADKLDLLGLHEPSDECIRDANQRTHSAEQLREHDPSRSCLL